MKRIDWNALDERERAAVLQRPVQAVSDAVRSGVAAIFGPGTVISEAARTTLKAIRSARVAAGAV